MLLIVKRLLRLLYIPLLVACGSYVSIHVLQHSEWYKTKLYRQLLRGNHQQQLEAASALAQFGGQQQLLAGLQSDLPEIRDLARRALEYSWFHAAGNEAHQILEKAYQASEADDFQTALRLLDGLIRKFPNFAEGWNRRASVYWQMDEYKKSISDCEKALALNPNHYGAWQGLGVCQVRLGDLVEACRSLRAALKIVPHDESTRRCLEQCEELLKKIKGRDRTGQVDVI